jgi:hypothetical protein
VVQKNPSKVLPKANIEVNQQQKNRRPRNLFQNQNIPNRQLVVGNQEEAAKTRRPRCPAPILAVALLLHRVVLGADRNLGARRDPVPLLQEVHQGRRHRVVDLLLLGVRVRKANLALDHAKGLKLKY